MHCGARSPHWLGLLQADAEKLCATTKPKNGHIQQCLRAKRLRLSWDCQEQLFRAEVDNSDDMRLQTRLFNVCLADKKTVRCRPPGPLQACPWSELSLASCPARAPHDEHCPSLLR